MTSFKCQACIQTNFHLHRFLRSVGFLLIYLIFFIFWGCKQSSTSIPERMTDLGIGGMEDSLDEGHLDQRLSDYGIDHQDAGLPIQTCEGQSTTPDCLTLKVQQSSQRIWSLVESNHIEWGETEEVNISGLYDQTPVPNWLEDRLGSILHSAQSEVSITPLSLSLASETSAFEIEINGLKADRIFQTGYQSWSFSGAMTVPHEIPRDENGHLSVQEAYTGDPFHGAHGVSFGVIGGQIGDDATEGVWLLAQRDPTYALTAFGATQASEGEHLIQVLVRMGFSDIPLRDQGQLSPQPAPHTGEMKQELLLIRAPNMWLGLRAYHQALKVRLDLLREQEIRSKGSKAIPLTPPRGWYSWNERFEDVDEVYIENHLDEVATKLGAFGFSLVEIDDGWQKGWGDWTSNEKFAQPFEVLVRRASELNLTLGLWFAPFLVDVEVAERLNYPKEWFVYPPLESAPTSLDDLVKPSELLEEPLRHTNFGNPRTYYILDATHPDAMEHVLTQLSERVAQGFGFFKLDFLYAGAIPGRRTQAFSGTESLRLGLEKIRNVIGENVIINACGAPVHAVLGYADSLRIGADTTFGDLYPAFIASAARSSAARAYLFPLVWPDGDQVQTRAPYSLVEAETGAYVAALSTAAYSIGDDLTQLPEDRLSIFTAEDVLWWANLQVPAIPLDLMKTPSQRWFGNPLLDHITAPTSTSAVPPNEFLGYNSSEWRRLRFEWTPTLSVSWDTLNE